VRPEFGVTAPPHRNAVFYPKPALAQEHSETSRLAAAAIEPHRANLQRRVYDAIVGNGGLTAQEIEKATGLAGNTVRPRIVELVKAGSVIDSGTTRLTRSRRKAVVWISATPAGRRVKGSALVASLTSAGHT
jgi:hypothetical protein